MHTELDETVFMQMPDEYWKRGHIVKLKKTLYKLQHSSILWQQMLKKALQNQDFREIPHEFCYITWDGILIFFYINNIVFAY